VTHRFLPLIGSYDGLPWTFGAVCGKPQPDTCSSARSRTVVKTIYKIVPRELWQEARSAGVFRGAPIDLKDGYIHFSTGAQAVETARLHFAGQTDLLLVAVDATVFGDALKWEASRGGDLFPHLFADLPLDAVRWEKLLPLGTDGAHVFPAEIQEA
jgi:uncharacterized protein (DUF952 family)